MKCVLISASIELNFLLCASSDSLLINLLSITVVCAAESLSIVQDFGMKYHIRNRESPKIVPRGKKLISKSIAKSYRKKLRISLN
jgi:hypothetical protein